jgi:uncharacterized protein (TIGR02453 family)
MSCQVTDMAHVGTDTGFAGLPRGTQAFLRDLEARNDRGWFEANRARYETDWLAPARALIAALATPCAVLEPPLRAEPKINGSIRRLQRDVRFSPDKRPFNARLHLVLAAGASFSRGMAVHLSIGPESFDYGAGVWELPPDALEAFRRRLAEPAGRAAFEVTLAAAAEVGCTLAPPKLKRVPKGFAAAPEWDHLIRRKGVVVRRAEPLPLPDWLFEPACVAEMTHIVGRLHPVLRFLAG